MLSKKYKVFYPYTSQIQLHCIRLLFIPTARFYHLTKTKALHMFFGQDSAIPTIKIKVFNVNS